MGNVALVENDSGTDQAKAFDANLPGVVSRLVIGQQSAWMPDGTSYPRQVNDRCPGQGAATLAVRRIIRGTSRRLSEPRWMNADGLNAAAVALHQRGISEIARYTSGG